MGRAILYGFKTEEEADAFMKGLKIGLDKEYKITFENFEAYVLDDRDYNGEWTINID